MVRSISVKEKAPQFYFSSSNITSVILKKRLKSIYNQLYLSTQLKLFFFFNNCDLSLEVHIYILHNTCDLLMKLVFSIQVPKNMKTERDSVQLTRETFKKPT